MAGPDLMLKAADGDERRLGDDGDNEAARDGREEEIEHCMAGAP